MGTQQSGILDLVLADLAKDGDILQQAREIAMEILETDANLDMTEHAPIRYWILTHQKQENFWSRIS
jgi:ATP-dependent DNA helicase RecG